MTLVSEDCLCIPDEATASLAIQLQMNDCQQLLNGEKGKTREGDHEDAKIALRLYMEELPRNAYILLDRRISQSIADAVQTDGRILVASNVEEERAAQDQRTAHELSGIQSGTNKHTSARVPVDMDDELVEKMNAVYVADLEDIIKQQRDSVPDAESSTQAESQANKDSKTNRQCISCFEGKDIFVVRVPCGHEYCQQCLTELFKASLTNESLFHPRCCRQPIHPEPIRLFLGQDIYVQYKNKWVELATPNRTYCCLPTCSAFIRPENIKGSTGVCGDCGTFTCITCKGEAHQGDCPYDVGLQQVLQIAAENNWQRCYACLTVVELQHGCNHILCRCGAQFCYVCGQPWKSCPCDQWDEQRLIARTELYARRWNPLAFEDLAADRGNQQLDQAMQHLRANHNCGHWVWNFIPGPHRCEECHHHLAGYILECNQCQLQVCNRCRRNRLL